MITIPKQIQRCRFIRVKSDGSKAPIGKWTTADNYAYDSKILQGHLRADKPYGVMAREGIWIIDCDSRELWDLLPEAWKMTFVVKTGRPNGEGRHVYLDVGKEFTKKIYINSTDGSVQFGDIRGSGSDFQVVGPYSPYTNKKYPDLPEGAKYLPIDPDAELVKVKYTEIDKWIKDNTDNFAAIVLGQRLGIVPMSKAVKAKKSITGSSNSFADKYNLRVEDWLMPNDATIVGNEIRGSHPIHGSETGNNLHLDTLNNTWYCFRCGSGGGGGDAYAVAKGIIQCGQAGHGAFDDKNVAAKMLKSLEDDGLKPTNEPEKVEPQNIITESELPSLPEKLQLKLKCNLEAGNFIREYIDYWKQRTDGYPEYHHMAAISLLSIATDRKLLIPLNFGELYTNIWGMALGKSGISRKSTALNKLDSFASREYPNKALPTGFSMESLVETLASSSHAYMILDECAGLIQGFNKKAYLSDVRDLFCNLYDCKGLRRKLRTSQRKGDKTDFNVRDPYISFAWATTYESFQRSVTPLDIQSGLMNRFLIYTPNYPKARLGAGIATQDMMDGQMWLERQYHDIVEALEPFTSITMIPSRESFERYNKWEEHQEDIIQKSDSDTEGGVSARVGPYIYKLAVLYYVGSKRFLKDVKRLHDELEAAPQPTGNLAYMTPIFQGKLEIPDRYFNEAMDNVEDYFYHTAVTTLEMVNSCSEQNIQEKIMHYLRERNGRASRSAILRKLRIKTKELTEHLDALTEANSIRVDFVGDNKQSTQYISIIEK